mmetsp:Transcript_1381/g.3237  ORF Transcript_1381/g.3237 Transcript_1381/m.3237 type:complete len:253 (+) Transcript_1381:1495-2253(+)
MQEQSQMKVRRMMMLLLLPPLEMPLLLPAVKQMPEGSRVERVCPERVSHRHLWAPASSRGASHETVGSDTKTSLVPIALFAHHPSGQKKVALVSIAGRLSSHTATMCEEHLKPLLPQSHQMPQRREQRGRAHHGLQMARQTQGVRDPAQGVGKRMSVSHLQAVNCQAPQSQGPTQNHSQQRLRVHCCALHALKESLGTVLPQRLQQLPWWRALVRPSLFPLAFSAQCNMDSDATSRYRMHHPSVHRRTRPSS